MARDCVTVTGSAPGTPETKWPLSFALSSALSRDRTTESAVTLSSTHDSPPMLPLAYSRAIRMSALFLALIHEDRKAKLISALSSFENSVGRNGKAEMEIGWDK